MRYVITSLILSVLFWGEAHAKDKAKSATKNPLPEISMGSAEAPVVVINYSSFTCTHCANFHTDVLPEIDKEYIKPGKVRIVFRDYPADQLSVQAHQLAWCQGELKYLNFSKVFYSTQDKWLTEKQPIQELKKIALKNGLTEKQIDACLKNQELLDKILQVRIDGQKKYKITATPTIIINAKIYPRTLTFKEFQKVVDPLLETKADKVIFKKDK